MYSPSIQAVALEGIPRVRISTTVVMESILASTALLLQQPSHTYHQHSTNTLVSYAMQLTTGWTHKWSRVSRRGPRSRRRSPQAPPGATTGKPPPRSANWKAVFVREFGLGCQTLFSQCPWKVVKRMAYITLLVKEFGDFDNGGQATCLEWHGKF